MTNKRMESVAWILVYSGMLLAALGWAVDEQGSVVGNDEGLGRATALRLPSMAQ